MKIPNKVCRDFSRERLCAIEVGTLLALLIVTRQQMILMKCTDAALLEYRSVSHNQLRFVSDFLYDEGLDPSNIEHDIFTTT